MGTVVLKLFQGGDLVVRVNRQSIFGILLLVVAFVVVVVVATRSESK